MSLLSNYNKDIKIVYSGSFNNYQGREYLLNGLLPEVNAYILKELDKDYNKSYSDIIEQLQKQNTDNSWASFVVHKNFYNYNKIFTGQRNVITVEKIINDGSVYLYPIEICITLNKLLERYTISCNSQNYNYEFIDTIDKKVLVGLRLGYIKLVLNYIHDPLENSNLLEKIQQYFNSHGIDSKNIVLIGGNSFDSHNSQLKITNGYIVLDQLANKFYEYPHTGSLGYQSDYVRPVDLDKTRIRKNKFICLNRNMHRPHRWLSAYLAAKFNLLNNNIFTFVVTYDYDKTKIKDTISNLINTEDDLDSIVDTIIKNIPKEIDTSHLPKEEKSGFYLNNNNKTFYLDSYINLVNETSFNLGGGGWPFITEKTFHHPIINLQPFIVIGNPFVLQTLRNLGFKTFSPLINEDYDQCQDHKQRFKLIEQEIAKLSNLPIQDIHDIYYQLIDVLVHNQNHAKTFSEHNPFEQAFNDIRNWYLK